MSRSFFELLKVDFKVLKHRSFILWFCVFNIVCKIVPATLQCHIFVFLTTEVIEVSHIKVLEQRPTKPEDKVKKSYLQIKP